VSRLDRSTRVLDKVVSGLTARFTALTSGVDRVEGEFKKLSSYITPLKGVTQQVTKGVEAGVSLVTRTLDRSLEGVTGSFTGLASEALRAQTGLSKLPNVLAPFQMIRDQFRRDTEIKPEKAPELYDLLSELQRSVGGQVSEVLKALEGDKTASGAYYRGLLETLQVYFARAERGEIFTKSEFKTLLKTLQDVEKFQDQLVQVSDDNLKQLANTLSKSVGRKLDQLVQVDETISNKFDIIDPREYLSSLAQKLEGSPLVEEGLDTVARAFTGPLWDVLKQITGVSSGVQLLTKGLSLITTPFTMFFGLFRRASRKELRHLSSMDRSLRKSVALEKRDRKSYFLYRIWDAVKKFMMFRWLGGLSRSLTGSLGGFFGVGAGAALPNIIGKLGGVATFLARFAGLPVLAYDLFKTIRKEGFTKGLLRWVFGDSRQSLMSRAVSQAGKGAIIGMAFGGPLGGLIGAGVGVAIGALGPYVVKGFTGLWDLIKKGWTWLTDKMQAAVTGYIEVVKKVADKVFSLFKSLMQLPGKIGSAILNAIKSLNPFRHKVQVPDTVTDQDIKATEQELGYVEPVDSRLVRQRIKDRTDLIETKAKKDLAPGTKPDTGEVTEPQPTPVPVTPSGPTEAPGNDTERYPFLIDDLGIVLAGSGLL